MGCLRIYIYSSNDSIKVRCLICIQLLVQLSKLASFLYRVVLQQLHCKKQVTSFSKNTLLMLELRQAIVYKRLLVIYKYLIDKVQAVIKIDIIILTNYRRNIKLLGYKAKQIIINCHRTGAVATECMYSRSLQDVARSIVRVEGVGR